MRLMTRLALCSLMASAGCLSAATITFQSSDLPDITPGQDLRRDVYSIGGITLQANEEIDIRFDPALYGTLSNGVAPPDFSLLLLQPNTPPGTFGDYSALSNVNNPSLAGPFSVDFVFLGTGAPGSQPFFINLYDRNGRFLRTVESGFTTSPGAAVPEPATLVISAL